MFFPDFFKFSRSLRGRNTRIVVSVLQTRNIADLCSAVQVLLRYSLTIRANRPIMKLDGKNIFCVFLEVFLR